MSLLVPDSGLLFWMLLSFGIVFFVLAKFGFPIITKMVDERKQYIDEYCIRTIQHLHELRGGIGSLHPSIRVHHALVSFHRYV